MLLLKYLIVDINECMEGTDACEDVCENIIGSYRCSCSHQGYQIQMDGTSCQSKIIMQLIHYYSLVAAYDIVCININHLDVDECSEGIDNCAQNCTDTDGSYDCSCRSGYRLANDSQGCDG